MLALYCFLVPFLMINASPVNSTNATAEDFCVNLTCEDCPKEGCNQLCAELACEDRWYTVLSHSCALHTLCRICTLIWTLIFLRSGMAVTYDCNDNDEPCKKASELCRTMDCRFGGIFSKLFILLGALTLKLLHARSATAAGPVPGMTLTVARIPWIVTALRYLICFWFSSK